MKYEYDAAQELVLAERQRVLALFDSYESQLQAQALALAAEGLSTSALDLQLQALRCLREGVQLG